MDLRFFFWISWDTSSEPSEDDAAFRFFSLSFSLSFSLWFSLSFSLVSLSPFLGAGAPFLH